MEQELRTAKAAIDAAVKAGQAERLGVIKDLEEAAVIIDQVLSWYAQTHQEEN